MNTQTQEWYLYETKQSKKLLATGIYKGYHTNSSTNNDMVVLAGSKMLKRNNLSKPQCITKRHEVENFSVREDQDGFILTENVIFTSPSRAAAVLLGREANGKELWLNHNHIPLKEIIPSASSKGVKKNN